MGKKPAARQPSPMWVTTADLPTSAGHPFFERLNRVLEEAGFDAFVEEWQSPQDTDAKIAKMKDGRTHLAHKAEHGIDLETGAILSVTVQEASEGDSATLPATLTMAAEQVEAVQPAGAEVEEVVADKGYHSDATLVALERSNAAAGSWTPAESRPRPPIADCAAGVVGRARVPTRSVRKYTVTAERELPSPIVAASPHVDLAAGRAGQLPWSWGSAK